MQLHTANTCNLIMSKQFLWSKYKSLQAHQCTANWSIQHAGYLMSLSMLMIHTKNNGGVIVASNWDITLDSAIRNYMEFKFLLFFLLSLFIWCCLLHLGFDRGSCGGITELYLDLHIQPLPHVSTLEQRWKVKFMNRRLGISASFSTFSSVIYYS